MDHDDDQDKGMAELLRQWGRDVRTSMSFDGAETSSDRALFSPPEDLTAMRRALDDIDCQVAGAGPSQVFPLRRMRWLRNGAALAACLGLVFVAWWFAKPQRGGTFVLAITDLSLSTSGTLLRGEPETQFRGADELYIHFTADRPGFAYVAMLDSRMVFAPVRNEVPFPVAGGSNALDRGLVLDHTPGTESIVLVVCETDRTAAAFEELIRDVAEGLDTDFASHDGKLRAILDALRSRPGVTAEAVTFQHLP